MTYKIKRCKICKRDYSPTGGSQKYCSSCKELAKREYDHRQARLEIKRKTSHAYYKANREKMKEQMNVCNFRLKTATWEAYFGGKHECQYDGEIHPHTNGKVFALRILEMHHTNGDGKEHKSGLGVGVAIGSKKCPRDYYHALKKNGWPKIDVISLCPTHHRVLHILEKQNAD